MKVQFVGAVLVGLALAGSAQAQTIQGSSTGLTSPAATITFEGLGNNVSISNQYAALGVIFGANWYASLDSYFSDTGGGLTSASNFQPCCTSPLDIFFTQAVQGAAFQYGSNLGLSTFTAFLNGQVVSHFTTVTGSSGFNTPQFWGFNNSVKLDEIRIDANNANDAFTIDNVQVGLTATPEPATLALLGTGFAGVFGVVQRRRKRTATTA